MKRILSLFISALAITAATLPGVQAQSRGAITIRWNSDRVTIRPDARTVTRDVRVNGNFNEIMSRGMADVEYRQTRGGRTKVEIVGPQNLVEYVDVKSGRGILEIGMTRNISVRGSSNLKVIVSGPGVEKVSMTGSGDLRIIGPFESRRFEIASQGSGDVRFDRMRSDDLSILMRGSGDVDGGLVDTERINISLMGSGDVEIPQITAQTIDVTLSGSGDIEIGGRAGNATYKLRGSGDIDASRLRAVGVNATLSGSGDIACHAEQNFRGSASGSGDITVGGNPRNVDTRGNKRSIRMR